MSPLHAIGAGHASTRIGPATVPAGVPAEPIASVILAYETRTLQRGFPTQAEITEAMRQAINNPTVPLVRDVLVRPGRGWWGPLPRVTRESSLGSNTTRVAWVFGWDTAPVNRASSDRMLREQVEIALGRIPGTTWRVESVPYVSSIHGERAWWNSGEAARTTTANLFPSALDVLVGRDNPVGPSSGGRPPTAAEVAGTELRQAVTQVRQDARTAGSEAARGAAESLWPVAAGIVVAGTIGGAAVVYVARTAGNRPVRANPRRRRR
jgi:phage gp46-like protein